MKVSLFGIFQEIHIEEWDSDTRKRGADYVLVTVVGKMQLNPIRDLPKNLVKPASEFSSFMRKPRCLVTDFHPLLDACWLLNPSLFQTLLHAS